MRDDAGLQDRARPGLRGRLSWLVKAPMADRFLIVHLGYQRYLAGPVPGNPRVGLAWPSATSRSGS